MKKRIKVLFFLCILLCCAFVFMNKGETLKDMRKLKVAVFDGAYDNAYWDEIASRFESEHPGVDVQLDINENIGNILLPRMAGNTLPDVVYLGTSNSSGFTQAMVKAENIASLADIFTPELNAQFMENVLDNYAIRPYDDQEVYLAPLYFNVTGLWYNKTLFTKYGYQIPSTWDEFFALGEQAKADGIDLFIYQGMNPTYLEALLWPMLADKIGLDGLHKIYQNDADAWSQEGVLEVFSTFAQLSSYMRADTISLTYMQAQNRFIEGTALFLPCGNWLKTEMQNAIHDEDDFQFMSVPSYEENAKRFATIMLEQIYVPKSAQEVELGKQFVAFQFEEENVALNQEVSGGFVPIIQDAQTVKNQPYQIFNEGITPITANFSPSSDIDMNHEVFEQVSNIISGTCTAQEAIDYLNMVMKEKLINR